MKDFDLLKKWVELEPDRCKAYPELGGIGILICPGHWFGINISEPLDQRDYATIQRGVQAAITAHGFGFELTYNPLTQTYWGQIFEEADGDFWHQWSLHEGNESSVALLEAYLAALEASRAITGGTP